SATSFAKDIRASLGFPLLERTTYPNLPDKDVGQLTPGEKRACGDLIGQVILHGGGAMAKRDMLITRSTVAGSLVEGYYFNTESAQDASIPGSGFREAAIGKIPARNIFGFLSYIRVHHGPKDADGFTAVLNRADCHPPQLSQLARFCANEGEARDLYRV